MTPDELEGLVLESKSAKALQKAFAPLNSSQRKKLSASAQKLFSQINRGKPNKDCSERLRKYFILRSKKAWNWDSDVLGNASLALLAVCPISALKKRGIFVPWDNREAMGRIILDRKPDWLDEWVKYDLEQEFSNLDFKVLRAWIKSGVCKKPKIDAYFAMFAHQMALPAAKEEPPLPPLSEQLIAEPDLLDDVLELFRIESSAFVWNNWTPYNAPGNYENWPDAIARLSESGHLDRQRLLDASLEGLSEDLKQNQLSGFHKFHKRLKPDKDERAKFEDKYLNLVSHKVGHVCKFALTILSKIEKDGNLDSKAFFQEVRSIFLHEAKGNAAFALKLIKRILKKQSEFSIDGIWAVVEALQHVSADVQEQAIDILEACENEITEDQSEAIAQYAGFVNASLRNRLSKLASAAMSEVSIHQGEDPPEQHNIEELVDALAPGVGTALRINELLANEDIAYIPISENIMEHSILPEVDPLDPIESVDDLIEITYHAVEVVESPDVIEQIIDGINRLCQDKSKDFTKKTAPLLHRLEQGGSENGKGILGYRGVELALADLVFTWLTSTLYLTPTSQFAYHKREENQFDPLINRIRTITRGVANGRTSALLSTPTHSGGWIDPVVWVRRLIEAEKDRSEFDDLDFSFSVLRLTPDNRTAALAEAAGLAGRYSRMAVFALGGEGQLTFSDRIHYDLWISAVRSRDPYTNWRAFLAPMKLHDPWPDSSEPAICEWRAYTIETKGYQEQVYKNPRLEITIRKDVPAKQSTFTGGLLGAIGSVISSHFQTDWKLLPTAALNKHSASHDYWSSDLNTPWVAKWLAYYWPLNPGGAFIAGARALAARIDDNSSSWSPGYSHLDALFQHNRPWGESGHLLLCLGLIGKDADVRGLSIDAVIEGIECGQFDPKLFAEILEDIAKGGWLKLNRLGDNLMQVARVSPLHAWVIGECIQLWLAKTHIKQHYIFRILEVLLEALVETRQTVDDDVRTALKRLKGSSKAAKTASKIIQLEAGNAPDLEAIKYLAISSRLRFS